MVAGRAYGCGDWSAEVRFQTGTAVTGVVEEDGQPSSYALSQNCPNPHGKNRIQYQVPSAARVRLAVCDLLGREDALLVDEMRLQGSHTVGFDASRCGAGATGLASGAYIYRLTADGPSTGSGGLSCRAG